MQWHSDRTKIISLETKVRHLGVPGRFIFKFKKQMQDLIATFFLSVTHSSNHFFCSKTCSIVGFVDFPCSRWKRLQLCNVESRYKKIVLQNNSIARNWTDDRKQCACVKKGKGDFHFALLLSPFVCFSCFFMSQGTEFPLAA